MAVRLALCAWSAIYGKKETATLQHRSKAPSDYWTSADNNWAWGVERAPQTRLGQLPKLAESCDLHPGGTRFLAINILAS